MGEECRINISVKAMSTSKAGTARVRGSHFSRRTREMGHPISCDVVEVKINVKGSGQECPLHAGYGIRGGLARIGRGIRLGRWRLGRRARVWRFVSWWEGLSFVMLRVPEILGSVRWGTFCILGSGEDCRAGFRG
jgi:hypothetical protein